MSRVLVTGANGFTGRYVTALLRKQGYEVHNIVRASDLDSTYDAARTHTGDLLDAARIEDIVRQVRPAKVVHLAAISFVAHKNVEAIYRVNIVGTRNLLAALADQEDRCDAVLLASSANVYGNATAERVTEETVLAPVNDYAVSKVAMEYLAQTYADRLPLIITRPFNYTGRGQTDNFLVPKIIDHIRRRAAAIELGNLDVSRDYSDVRDLAAIYCKLLDTPSAIGRTLNVCSGTAYSLSEIVEMAQKVSGHKMEIMVNPAFVRQNELKVLRGSQDNLLSVIGYMPSHSFEDTLSWMM